MVYSQYLKERYPGIDLQVEDLLLLESFQIKYLPDRVPAKEFAILLHNNPIIHQFLELKYPPISGFIDSLLSQRRLIESQDSISEASQELLWEIADLIIYNKHPEVYDERSRHAWEINDITSVTSLEGKTVVDAGAGTGRLAFLAAPFAQTVYAVEPVTGMRRFMKEKAARENINNLYVMDGFLESIPLPDSMVDLLMTSNAIGWNLEDELREIERVLRPGAHAIHFIKADTQTENLFHDILVSEAWNYAFVQTENAVERKTKYFKTLSRD
jgi:ubiquinone/menaquinone biosynthesis C-methylase UbiE